MYAFKFADIGEGIHEGVLLKWMFKVGDNVKEGETLFLVETDKVNAEIPSPVDGKVAELLAEEGDTIHVGDVVIKIDDGSAVEKEAENLEKSEPIDEGEEGSAGVVGEIEVSSEVIESSHEGTGDEEQPKKKKILATPVARKLAKDLGIDIRAVEGSGPQGRVMKDDIYRMKETMDNVSKQPSENIEKDEGNLTYPSPIKIPDIKITGETERVSISKLRRTIAQNMVLSKSIIPHASTMDDFDVTELVKFRKEQKGLAEEKGIKLTYMPFIIKAVTLALKEYPVFNASYDDKKEELILKKYYNVGMAVDTPDGLIVPVIKRADGKGILEIAEDIQTITDHAKDRTIGLDKLQDGTFTITNYGSLGSTYGVPVIKYPEVAILGIGKITKKPVVIDDEIVIRSIMPVSLSIDHRVIDGGDAGRFLLRLKELLNDPMLLLLS